MARRRRPEKREILPDPRFGDQVLSKFMNSVMLDGKMEDDASLKQCLVMVELAEQLAAIDPELKAAYDAIEVGA